MKLHPYMLASLGKVFYNSESNITAYTIFIFK